MKGFPRRRFTLNSCNLSSETRGLKRGATSAVKPERLEIKQGVSSPGVSVSALSYIMGGVRGRRPLPSTARLARGVEERPSLPAGRAARQPQDPREGYQTPGLPAGRPACSGDDANSSTATRMWADVGGINMRLCFPTSACSENHGFSTGTQCINITDEAASSQSESFCLMI